jgi:DegV family protein with EDD domain
MEKYILLVETGADLPADLADRFHIQQVSMHVSFGDDTRDDGTIPIRELFSYYESHGVLPQTSGCTPHDFEKAFDAIRAQHPDKHILHLAYSAATTCSYQSALLAAEDRENITSIDTKHVSAGQTLVTLATAHYLQEHPDCSVEQITEVVTLLRENCRMAFFPGDLAYLKAGGRVSNAAYLGAKLLALNPLIEVNDGRLEAVKKYRGSMKKVALHMLKEYTESKQLDKRILAFVYSEGLDETLKQSLADEAQQCGFERILWVQTGCVVSTHSGPGAFGVSGFTVNDKLNALFS